MLAVPSLTTQKVEKMKKTERFRFFEGRRTDAPAPPAMAMPPAAVQQMRALASAAVLRSGSCSRCSRRTLRARWDVRGHGSRWGLR